MERKDLLKLMVEISTAYMHTGSRYICNPPPMDTDEDYLLYGDLGLINIGLRHAGFKMTAEQYAGGSFFLTYRLGEYNILATDSEVLYERFAAATLLAKARNLLEKQDRIDLFQLILYGDIPKFQIDDKLLPPMNKHEIPIDMGII